MSLTNYQQSIVSYYDSTENSYKDSWDLDRSLSLHYGFWDNTTKNFPESLLRMNEIMIETAGIKSSDVILDAGCGIGGSSIFLAERLGCKVTGISLSQNQIDKAKALSVARKIDSITNFLVMDYCRTSFPDQSFDVIWACESSCYAPSKEEFIKEAFRLLKPGGRLIVADGFVSEFSNNEHPIIKNWLEGWMVKFLESPARFNQFMTAIGFVKINYNNISKFTMNSSKRLYRFYFLAIIYSFYKKIIFSKSFSEVQNKNVSACKFQYQGMKKKLWEYGMFVGTKPL